MAKGKVQFNKIQQAKEKAEVKKRNNTTSFWMLLASILGFIFALVCWYIGKPFFIKSGCFIGLASGAAALFLAESENRIKQACWVLGIQSLFVFLRLEVATKPEEPGVGFYMLLVFSLLCLTGAVVDLLRNWIGRLTWIQEHDTWGAVVLAIFIGLAGFFKMKKDFPHASEIVDLSLVFAGVVTAAMFEKERIKIRLNKNKNK